MTEESKLIFAAISALVVGYVSGRLQAWHNYRRDSKLRRDAEIESIEKEYLNKRATIPNFDSEPKWRMKLLQQLGAYRFNAEELARIRSSIIARGFADPLAAHKETLGLLENYPYCVFSWAREHQVNLGSIVSVLTKWIEIHEGGDVEEGSELDHQLLNWRVTLEIWKRAESSQDSGFHF